MLKILAVLIVCLAGVVHPVQAQQRQTGGFFSTAYLAALCESDAKGREVVKSGHTACQSYISAVVDYQKLMQSMNVAPVIDFCVPNTVPMKKLQNIVWNYLRKNTQHAQFVAAPAVTLALYEAYPCPKKTNTKKRR